MKLCTKCKNIKPLDDFNLKTKSKDGRCPRCKNCLSEDCRSYRNRNIQKIKISKRKHVEQRQEYYNKYKKNWYLKNRDRILSKPKSNIVRNKPDRTSLKYRIYIKNYHKARMENDPLYKIVIILRKRLSVAVKSNAKRGSAVRDLGCTVPQFKAYLEAKFQPGMTWDSYGRNGWHIDHINPLASFDLTDYNQLKQACHYTNLQPLWAKDNYKKIASDMKIIQKSNISKVVQ